MRAVIQRVSRASVSVEDKIISSIEKGILVLLGVEDTDSLEDVEWLSKKISNLRIFPDDAGVMNRSVTAVDGELIVVSQFTLHAMTKKGNRPSYIKAAGPDIAVPLYEAFCNKVSELTGKKVGTGVFGAEMRVELINDGPVTIIIDTKNKV